MLEEEPYPAVLWWICKIDINALLSGCGKGEFIDDMMKTNEIPTVAALLQFPCIAMTDVAHAHGREAITSTLTSYQKLFLIAAEIGQLARHLRQQSAMQRRSRGSRTSPTLETQSRQQVSQLREKLKEFRYGGLPASPASRQRPQCISGQLQSILDQVSSFQSPCSTINLPLRAMLSPGSHPQMRHAYNQQSHSTPSARFYPC